MDVTLRTTRCSAPRTMYSGQMAAFLVRGLGYSDVGDGDLFVDCDNSVFELDIDKLGTAGVNAWMQPAPQRQVLPAQPRHTRSDGGFPGPGASGYTDVGEGDLFTDDDGSIFENDIDKLATAGVTRGCNPPLNDEYCPSAFVTREQMAAFPPALSGRFHLPSPIQSC